MGDPIDYSTLTEEQLDALISGQKAEVAAASEPAAPGQGAAQLARRNAAAAELARMQEGAPPIAEQIEPSAWKRALAGMGGAMLDPLAGAAEKIRMAFPGEGETGKQTFADVGAERTARRGALSQLRETPAGQAGAFVGEVAPYMAAPASIPAQMGMAGGIGFMRGGADKPSGIGSELMTSGLNAAVESGTTGAVMKGLQLAGKGVNAARGRYSNEGQKLMDLDAAAQRVGLTGELRPGIGQLDPNSPAGIMERNMPSYSKRVEQQAAKIAEELTSQRQTPGVKPGSTVTQDIPGGKLTDELTQAINTRMTQGADKYKAVDDLAAANGVGNITPIYSVPQLSRLQKNAAKGDEASLLAVNMVGDYDQYALSWLGNQLASGATQAQIKAAGIPVSEYHMTRVAVNKALNNLQRVNPANKTGTQMQAQRMLTDLRDGLDNEAEAWAKQNAGQREVIDAYNSAKQFYRETVAPAILDNPFARKVTSRRTPFKTAEELYGAMQAPGNQELIDRLVPTMGPIGRDIETTLRGLPDVGRTLARREAPPATSRGGLEALARTGLGHPMTALAEMAPGLGWVGRTTPAKRLYAAQDPLSQPLSARATVAGSQYLQDDPASKVRKILSQR